MSDTAQRIADDLEEKAATAAAAKLKRFHGNVQDMWSEANSIPSGCGGTPFRSAARHAESKLHEKVDEFRKKYGQDRLDKLGLFYGVTP